MLVIPTPTSVYNGNYASLAAAMLRPPIEGNRTIPLTINWLQQGQPPNYTIDFNIRQRQVQEIRQICALHVDNTKCGSSIHVIFPDTQFQLALGPNSEGFYPVVTASLEFFAYIDTTPQSQDQTVIQVLNFLPPPIFFTTQPGGSSVGTVREVDTVAPLQGGPITDQGSISLSTPLAINYGGTGGTTGNAAFDNLSGTSGTTVGALSRNASGIWSVQPAPVVPVTVPNGGTGNTSNLLNAVLVGNGAGPISGTASFTWNGATLAVTGAETVSGALTAGSVTTAGALSAGSASLTTPLPVASGGTGATTAAGAAWVQKSGDTMTGPLTLNTTQGLVINQNATAPGLPPGVQTETLSIMGANGSPSGLSVAAFGTGAVFPQFLATKTRGTAAAPTAVGNGDVFLNMGFSGYGATTYGNAGSINVQASEVWTDAAHGSLISFNTIPAGGSTSTVPSLILQGNSATFSGTINAAGTIQSGGSFITGNGSSVEWQGSPNWVSYATANTWHLNIGSGEFLTVNSTGVLQVNNHGTGGGVDNQAMALICPTNQDCMLWFLSQRTWEVGTRASTSAVPGAFSIADLTAGAGRLQIDASGNCTNTTGTWSAISDRSLKRNVESYTRGLDAVLGLNPVEFDYTDEVAAPGRHHGLIADEAEKIVPEIVGKTSIGQTVDDPGREVQTVDSGKLTFALINAVKELAAKVAALESQLARV